MGTAAPPKRDIAACVLLILVAVGVFWPWLFTGRALYWGDLGVYFQPLLHFERGQLLRGTLPLWNPLVFCGTPFFGNPQMWPLYPSTLLLPLATAARFLTVSCALHIALGGLFFYAFVRRGCLGLSVWPSLFGAAAFMLGGYFVTKTQYPNMLQALAWVPIILLLTERLTVLKNAQAALTLGAALGLQLLAAHAQVTLYTLYFALILGVFRLWGQGKSAWLRSAGWGIVSGAIALGLSCGEWLPVVDARRFAARQTLTLAHVNRLHLPFVELTNFALPDRYGNPMRGDWSGAGPAWETACYAGTLTLALALMALVYGLRVPEARRETVFWLGIFAGSLWLALGAEGGVFRIAYAVVPGMKLFHDPARLLLGAAVALPVLGALGLKYLLSLPRLMSPRAAQGVGGLCLLLLVVDLGHYDRGLAPLQPVATLENPARQSAVLRAASADPVLQSGAGRVLSMDDIAASTQFQSWTDYEANLPGCVPRLAQTFLPNLPVLIGLSDAGGYEPLALARSTYLGSFAVSALNNPSGGPDTIPGSPAQIAPLLGWMSVRMVTAYRPQPPPPVPGLVPALSWADPGGVNHGFVRANTLWQPRARLYFAWQTVPGDTPFAPAGWMASLPVVDGPAPASVGAPARPLPAAITQETPDFVAISLPTKRPKTVGLLMLADTHFPGWAASINNAPTPVLRVNGVFRAVMVPPDARRVTFSYQPVSVRLGLYVSLLTVALLLAGGLISRRKVL